MSPILMLKRIEHMLATEKNIKKLMVEICNDFVSDFLFDIEYDQ